MPRYFTEEYEHLLAAERVLAKELESPPEKSSAPMLARALVDVVQMKRFIRGKPNPKPTDVQAEPRRRSSAGSATPTDGPTEPPA